MEIERKTAVQVAVSVAVVAVFLVGLIGLSSVYGSEVSYENESLSGTVEDGTLGEPADGTVSFRGGLDGEFTETAGGIEVAVNGTVDEPPAEGRLGGAFTATIDDSIANGTVTGTLNGSVNDGTFEGEFEGTITASGHDTEVTAGGGLALVGLIAAFIMLMPVAGYFIERSDG